MIKPYEVDIELSGYSCKADFYDVGNSKQTVLYLIGYTSNKESYINLVSRVMDKTGFNALVLDYSGHGVSPYDLNDCTQDMNFAESIRAFDWIKENYPESEIYVIGTSYGGYFAALLSGFRKFKKLMMRVPGSYQWTWFYTKWVNLLNEDERIVHRQSSEIVLDHPLLVSAADSFTGDVFVLTHELDKVCPKASTDAFIKLFNAETWEAKGFVHSFRDSNRTVEQMEEYQTVIAEWLKK